MKFSIQTPRRRGHLRREEYQHLYDAIISIDISLLLAKNQREKVVGEAVEDSKGVIIVPEILQHKWRCIIYESQ